MRKSIGRLAVAAGALVMLAPGVSRAADPFRLTTPVQATKDDPSPGRLYSAPSLLVDPNNQNIIVGGFAEMRNKSCGLIRSTNGGQTWKILEASPQLKSYPFCLENNSNVFQGQVAWGGNHTLYYVSSGWDNQDTRNRTSVIVARSTDLGDSWSPVVARDTRPTTGADQEIARPITGIVVDAKNGTDDVVYVSYRRGFTDPSRTAPNAPFTQPTLVVSKDGARTFGAPVSAIDGGFDDEAARTAGIAATTTVPNSTTTTAVAGSLGAKPNQAANFGAAGNGQGLTIDSKGNVYLAWMTASVNIVPSVPSGLVVSKSTDQGKTWTASFVRPFSYENRQNPRMMWSPQGGADGTLHLVWEGSDKPAVSNFAEVKYSRSTDGGKTWTPTVRLADDDPARLAGKFLPNVQIAPNGRVDVVWWDTRDDPGVRANDVYYTYSIDNGKNWARNVRVTDQTVDRRFGVWGNNFDQNSPPSLASTNQLAVFAWDDTRFSRGEDGPVVADNPIPSQGFGSGVQDIFVSVAQFSAIGGGTSKAAKLALAGVVGLVVVGLVLLLIGLGSRRRQGDDAPARESVAGTKSSKVR